MNINLTDILSQIPENGKVTSESIESITEALRKELNGIKTKQEKEEAEAEKKRQREKEEAAKQAAKEKEIDAARRNLLKATRDYLVLTGQISENKIKGISEEEELNDLMFVFDILEGKSNKFAKQNAEKKLRTSDFDPLGTLFSMKKYGVDAIADTAADKIIEKFLGTL